MLGLGGALGATPGGHTGWTEGQTLHIGVTLVLPPDTPVLFAGPSGPVAVDQLSGNEGSPTRLSYDAVTSRSYHTGPVNVLLMAWRAADTRAGGEATPLG